MKKRILLINLFICVIFCSCKKINKFTTFDMEFNNKITIPSSTGINLPFNISTPDVSTNSESTFSSNDTRKDLIEEIKLTNMKLTIIAPPNGNFDFLKSIEIYISASGLNETKMAWKTNIANGQGNELILDTSSEDLKEYIKKDKFVLRCNAVTDELITQDYEINVKSIFHVDAKILGI